MFPMLFYDGHISSFSLFLLHVQYAHLSVILDLYVVHSMYGYSILKYMKILTSENLICTTLKKQVFENT